MGEIDNPSPGELTQQYEIKTALKRTMSGTIENEVSLDLQGIAAFSHNESITVGQEVSIEAGLTLNYKATAWTEVSCWIAQNWEERKDKCCVFGTNGFVGRRNWNGTYVYPTYSIGMNLEYSYPH